MSLGYEPSVEAVSPYRDKKPRRSWIPMSRGQFRGVANLVRKHFEQSDESTCFFTRDSHTQPMGTPARGDDTRAA